MLTPERAIKLLHSVNLQINSNTLFIKPSPSFNLINRFGLMMDTRRSLAQLHKSYPSQKLDVKDNLLSSFAMLYSQFRTAVAQEDEPMLHRYLTNSLYQQWKENRSQMFKPYSIVYDIKLKQAQIYENEYGKWIQCWIKMKHNDNVVKQHIAERKLGMMQNYARKWYFVQFEN